MRHGRRIDALNWKDGNTWPTNQTVNTYTWRDGPVLDLTTFNGAWTTDYQYEIIGGQAQLARAVIADGRPRTVTFVNDFLGQGIKRDEQDGYGGGDPHEIWYRFSGRQQAYVGNNPPSLKLRRAKWHDRHRFHEFGGPEAAGRARTRLVRRFRSRLR